MTDSLVKFIDDFSKKKLELQNTTSLNFLIQQRNAINDLLNILISQNVNLVSENENLKLKVQNFEHRSNVIKDKDEEIKKLNETLLIKDKDIEKLNNEKNLLLQVQSKQNKFIDDLQLTINQNDAKNNQLEKKIKTLYSLEKENEKQKKQINGLTEEIKEFTAMINRKQNENLELSKSIQQQKKQTEIPDCNSQLMTQQEELNEKFKQSYEDLKNHYQKFLSDKEQSFLDDISKWEEFKKQMIEYSNETTKKLFAWETNYQNLEKNTSSLNASLQLALRNCLYIIQQYKGNEQCLHVDESFYPINETQYWKYTATLFYEYVKLYHATKTNSTLEVDLKAPIENFDPTKIEFYKPFFENILFPEAEYALFNKILDQNVSANYQYYVSKKYSSKYLLEDIPNNNGLRKDSFLLSLLNINNNNRLMANTFISADEPIQQESS